MNKKVVIKDKMKKCLLYKIIVLSIAVFLIAAPKAAFASFTDRLQEENAFSAGTLSVAVTQNGNTIPNNAIEFRDIARGGRNLGVEKTGTLPFKYTVSLQNISGHSDFCNAIAVSLRRGSEVAHSGPLTASSTGNAVFEGEGDLDFTFAQPNSFTEAKLCTFDIVVSAWQETAASFETSGFTDTEVLTVVIMASPRVPAPVGAAVSDPATEEVPEAASAEEPLEEETEIASDDASAEDGTSETENDAAEVLEEVVPPVAVEEPALVEEPVPVVEEPIAEDPPEDILPSGGSEEAPVSPPESSPQPTVPDSEGGEAEVVPGDVVVSQDVPQEATEAPAELEAAVTEVVPSE